MTKYNFYDFSKLLLRLIDDFTTNYMKVLVAVLATFPFDRTDIHYLVLQTLTLIPVLDQIGSILMGGGGDIVSETSNSQFWS